MVKLTKIYTRSGDQGLTGLGSGQRVPKDNLRVSAYGDIDELNSFLGLAIVHVDDTLSIVRNDLLVIQNELFDLGADLCVPIEPNEEEHAVLRITQASIDRLEQQIDTLNIDLEPLKSFVLPGGTEIASRLHVARAVARRAERSIVTLCTQEPDQTSPLALQYINRLSDYLFVLARWLNHKEDGDILWVPGKSR